MMGLNMTVETFRALINSGSIDAVFVRGADGLFTAVFDHYALAAAASIFPPNNYIEARVRGPYIWML